VNEFINWHVVGTGRGPNYATNTSRSTSAATAISTVRGGKGRRAVGGDSVVSTAIPSSDVNVLTEKETEATLSKDDLFELLKNPRRRAVLRFLESTDGNATLSELAEHIAAQENDIEVQQLNAYQRKRVYVALYQCHLPKMDDADIVDYDQDRGDIELREEADQLLTYLDSDDDAETDWSRRYIALSAGGGTFAAAVQFVDVAFVVRTGLTLAVLALFLGVSLLHTYETR